jgi:hypothetical protein
MSYTPLLNDGAIVSFGTTTIDFGSTPLSSQEFTIVDANVNADSIIQAALGYDAPAGKDLDEIPIDKLNIICGQAGIGTFVMFINTTDGSYLSGEFIINYTI